MKLVVFNDLHGSLISFRKVAALVKKSKPDAILCLGDFTIFEQNIEGILSKINSLSAPVYLIHGNHEDERVVRRLCKNYPNITFIHKRIVKLGDVKLVGYGGGGFYGHGKLKRDKEFDSWISNKHISKRSILLTHAPPAHTTLDLVDYFDEHVGCPSFTSFIKKHKPLYAFSGHIHESFGQTQKLGKTILYNVGPKGKLFTI